MESLILPLMMFYLFNAEEKSLAHAFWDRDEYRSYPEEVGKQFDVTRERIVK